MNRKHSLDTAFTLLLFSLFALLSLFLVLIGASVYRRAVHSSEQQVNQRVAISYVTNKIHSADAEGAVRAEEIEGHSVLVLEDAGFETWIYCESGALYELLVLPGDDIHWGAGEQLTELNSFYVLKKSNEQLRLTAEGNGWRRTLHISLRADMQ